MTMEQNRVQEITRRAEELLSAGFEDGKYNDEMSWNDVDAEDKSALIEGLKGEFGVPARTANYFLEDAFETVKRGHNIKDDPEPDPLITDLYDEAFPIKENNNKRKNTAIMKINENDIKAMVAECVKRIIKEYSREDAEWDYAHEMAYDKEQARQCKALVAVDDEAMKVFGENEDAFLDDLYTAYEPFNDDPKGPRYEDVYFIIYGEYTSFGEDGPEDMDASTDVEQAKKELKSCLKSLSGKYEKRQLAAFYNLVCSKIDELNMDDFYHEFGF